MSAIKEIHFSLFSYSQSVAGLYRKRFQSNRRQNVFARLLCLGKKNEDMRTSRMIKKTDLSNPLLRLEQLGTGWFGLIVELDVFLGDNPEKRQLAWKKVAQMENLRIPTDYDLKRLEYTNPTRFISQIMYWSTDPSYIVQLVKKHRLCVQEDVAPKNRNDLKPGIKVFLNMLELHGIPCIVTSSENRSYIRAILVSLGIHSYFDVIEEGDMNDLYNRRALEKIVGNDDVANGLPDPEIYAFAANILKRPCERCVVVGISLSCCEAAHALGMKCILLQSGRKKRWELACADIVRNSTEQIHFQDLKELFCNEISEMNTS